MKDSGRDRVNNKASAEDVFLMWKTVVEKEVGKEIYTHNSRLEHLEELCEMYREYGVDYDDAIMQKKRFIEFVVTPEGMKGNGKHKNWKSTAEENYIGLVNTFYSDMFQKEDISHINNKTQYGEGDYMPRMNIIVDWTKHKFGKNWSESLCLEAHKIGSMLNNTFQKEVLESKWAKTGKNVPVWAEGYCS